MGPSRERGFGGQRPQLEDCSTYVWQKWRCVGVRKVSHGMADGSPRPMTNPPRLYTYLTPRQHTADSVEWQQNTISKHNIESVALQRRKIYIHTTGPHLGAFALHSLLLYSNLPLLQIGSGYFRSKSFPQQSHSGYYSCLHRPRIWNRQRVPKRRHIKFRRRGITQK